MKNNHGILTRQKDKVLRYLENTTLTFEEIGKVFGTSRQAVKQFFQRHPVLRPPRPPVVKILDHRVDKCDLCTKIIQISKKLRSEFLTKNRVANLVGLDRSNPDDRERFSRHLHVLKKGALVDKKFASIQKEKYVKAFLLYLTRSIPMSKIGKTLGIKNFQSIRDRYREKGFNLPPSKFHYSGEARKRSIRLGHLTRKREAKLK